MKYFVICFMFFPFFASAQKDTARWQVGVEQDLLPYVTGGYFLGGWLGKNQLRSRLLIARVHKPDFVTRKGFANNRVTAYAATLDYFLKRGWRGWWVSAALVYWKSSIQTDARISTAYFNNTLLNGSAGYHYFWGKRWYLCPWAGLHVRVAGTGAVLVDGKVYSPPLLNPEASLKVGYCL